MSEDVRYIGPLARDTAIKTATAEIDKRIREEG